MIRKVEGQTYNPPKEGLMSSSGQTITFTEAVIDSVLIPANTFAQYDIVDILNRVVKTGTNQNVIVKIRIGPSINTSETLVGTSSQAGTINVLTPIFRRLFIQNVSNSTYVLNEGTTYTGVIDLGPSIEYSNITTIDWTVDNYIIITIISSAAITVFPADVEWSTYIVTKLV
jgi:hypothetical protein